MAVKEYARARREEAEQRDTGTKLIDEEYIWFEVVQLIAEKGYLENEDYLACNGAENGKATEDGVRKAVAAYSYIQGTCGKKIIPQLRARNGEE
jgi:hypothetical protein